MKISTITFTAVLAIAGVTTAHAFVSAPSSSVLATYSPSTITTKPCFYTTLTQLHAKGFGAAPPEPRKKSEGQIDREQKASKYDDIAATGGQEYRIFVRQFGSDDKSWLPVGSIAVPRGAQVSDAVFANEEGLRTAIVRTYSKLKGMEMEFEYGYNLKIYPDDPIQVATKVLGGSSSGPSISNWISNLLSPVDASGVALPPVKDD